MPAIALIPAPQPTRTVTAASKHMDVARESGARGCIFPVEGDFHPIVAGHAQVVPERSIREVDAGRVGNRSPKFIMATIEAALIRSLRFGRASIQAAPHCARIMPVIVFRIPWADIPL